MTSEKRRYVRAALVAGLAACVMVGATTAHGQVGRAAAVSATSSFTDPAGDAQGGPDVRAFSVTGDAATSSYSMTAELGFDVATPDALERDVVVWMDTDRNRATGDPEDGTEYALWAWNDATGDYWNLDRWNGTEWVDAGASPTASASGRDGSVTWRLNAADIGGAREFRFYVMAGTWDSATDRWTTEDYAPDNGWWEYTPSGTTPSPPAPETKVKLLISAPKTQPQRAVAGNRLVVSFRVDFQVEQPTTTIDITGGGAREGVIVTWVPVKKGKFASGISLGGKTIAHRRSLENGKARISLVVPATAKGKLLRVTVKVTASEKETGKTLTASRVATIRIR